MAEPIVTTAAADPAGTAPELTLRAILVGLVVAALIGASYPYVVLKLGFGPTISVVAAFFAYLGLNLIALITGKKSNRYEYNMVQTAGTSAGQAAFMCVVLAAFDMLQAVEADRLTKGLPPLGFHVAPTPLQVFIWMSLAGMLGVLLAVPLRKHYIDEQNLTFADGTAAGESLVLLDAGTKESKAGVKVLGVGGAIGAISTWFRDGVPKWIPDGLPMSEKWEGLHVGMDLSALSFGSGLIVGLRITLSMAIGMALAWYIAPSFLLEHGWIASAAYLPNLRWVMWPATGLLVSGGITALLLKWKLIVKTFRDLAGGKMGGGTDFPIAWVGIGSGVLSVALILFQYFVMEVAIWESVAAILVSVVLMLVGIRVLGETNWAPISAMANMVQGLFAAISPGSIGVNMVASGMSGTIAGSGETLMQDFKAAQIIGSNNRSLTVMQLIATPVGAGAIAIVYPLLRSSYGIGAGRYGIDPSVQGTAPGLSSPISVKWAGFAELLKEGISKLEPHALWALGIGAVLGILITLFEEKNKKYLPSPTGIALGMLIPAAAMLPMLLGGIAQAVWAKVNAKNEATYNVPLASGLIVGEAMIALLIPAMLTVGILGVEHPMAADLIRQLFAPLIGFAIYLAICHRVGNYFRDGRSRTYAVGVVLAFLLTPLLGWIIGMLLPVTAAELARSTTHKKCQFCAEAIQVEATLCRFCQRTQNVAVPPTEVQT